MRHVRERGRDAATLPIGLGVDAIDALRQCYEIKMCSGATMPSDVTLTASEIEAARDDPDFFLAIVTGLEEGAGKLRVRFIFDPLGQLDVRVRTDLTLTGVDRAEALEFEFDAAAYSVPTLKVAGARAIG